MSVEDDAARAQQTVLSVKSTMSPEAWGKVKAAIEKSLGGGPLIDAIEDHMREWCEKTPGASIRVEDAAGCPGYRMFLSITVGDHTVHVDQSGVCTTESMGGGLVSSVVLEVARVRDSHEAIRRLGGRQRRIPLVIAADPGPETVEYELL